MEFGLETREVCKKAYHRPTQIFLSLLDKGISFDRNYDRIRPFSPYCEEIMTWEKRSNRNEKLEV
ncbi:MAG: hypothetical protein ACE5H4_07080 [Candidatus Thorarchaeota archaeon]